MEHPQRLQQFVIDPVEGLLAVFVRERGGADAAQQGVGADADAALRKDQDLLSIPQAPSGLTRSGRIVSAPIDGNGQHQFQEESS